MDIVDFGGYGVARNHGVIPPTVFIKPNWRDEWAEAIDFWPYEINWSCAPSLPTVTLWWKYGWTRTPQSIQFFRRLRLLGIHRWFIKIECPTLDVKFDYQGDETIRRWTRRFWYGVLDIDADQLGGVGFYADADENLFPVPSGQQTFTAYGMEKLLADQTIEDAYFVWFDPTAGPAGRAVIGAQNILPAFNAGGNPNRTFDAQPGGGIGGALSTHVFETDRKIAQYWSTKDIVEYLMHRVSPRNTAGDIAVDFRADILALDLNDKDRPVIDQQGQTVYSILARLLDRRRLRLWWLSVQDPSGAEDPDTGGRPADAMETVYLNTATMNGTEIPPFEKDASPIPENANKINIRCDFDQTTTVAIKRSSVEQVDQVVAQGDRRVSVFTVSFMDSSLGTAWDPALTDDYNKGASETDGYDEAGTKERQRMNTEARNADRLEDVFTLFEIPGGWDQLVGDGLGGLPTVPEQWAVFPNESVTRDDDERFGPAPAYLGHCHLLQALPLLSGVDYSGDRIANGTVDLATATGEPVKPFALFRKPESLKGGDAEDKDRWRWARADEIGDNAGLEVTEAEEADRWSATVFIPYESKQVKLRVTGAPQHIVDDETLFTPLEHEGLRVDPELAKWNIHEGAVITVAMEDPRRVNAVWPPMEDLADRDVIRRKFIDADGFRKIYVVPETIVDIDEAGKLKRTDGGFIPHAGADGDEDDVAKLATIARNAFEWYGVQRKVLVLESLQLRGATNQAADPNDFANILPLGAYVEEFSQDTPDAPDDDPPGTENLEEIKSVVTSVVFTYPWNGTPHMTVQTFSGELDALQVAPLPAGLERAPAPRAAFGDRVRRFASDFTPGELPGTGESR